MNDNQIEVVIRIHKFGCRYFAWMTIKLFHNFRLIRQIQWEKITKNIRHLTRNWTQTACLTVRHFNHYTRMFSVLVWGCNWILFMHGWFFLSNASNLSYWTKISSFWKKTRMIPPCERLWHTCSCRQIILSTEVTCGRNCTHRWQQ